MSGRKLPELAVFWGDTRELLADHEKRLVLQNATLESVHTDEILLRDPTSLRLIVVTSAIGQQNLFCSVCKHDLVRQRYGRTCPSFATCIWKGHQGGPNGKAQTS